MESDRRPEGKDVREPRASCGLGLLGAGTLIAFLAHSLPWDASVIRPPDLAPVALWVADRDGQQVYALDADLIIARRFHCAWPLAVEPCRDGGVWVLRAGSDTHDAGDESNPSGPVDTGDPEDHGQRSGRSGSSDQLERWSAGGELLSAVALDRCIDLERSTEDDALVIEAATRSHAERALRVRSDGSVVSLYERPGLACIAHAGRAVALGTSTGTVLRVDPLASGSIVGERDLGGSLGDLAPGPEEGSLWALDVRGPRRLHLLDAQLGLRWSTRVELAALHIAAVPNEERVWLCDTLEPRVRRFGPEGQLELDLGGLSLAGLDRATAWLGGGVLLAAPGAILHLDARGQPRPGQGGFSYLVDVGRVP